jgi:hypothetical protein
MTALSTRARSAAGTTDPAAAPKTFTLKETGVRLNELTLAQDQMMLLGRRTAEEKVVSFLLHMRGRWAKLGRPSPQRQGVSIANGGVRLRQGREIGILRSHHTIRTAHLGHRGNRDLEGRIRCRDGTPIVVAGRSSTDV